MFFVISLLTVIGMASILIVRKNKKISSHAMLSANTTLIKTQEKVHALNFTGTFLDSKEKNGGVENTQSSAKFYNGGLSWNTQFIPQKITASLGYNINHNITGIGAFTTQGPIALVAWLLLDDKLVTSMALSYNNASGGTAGASSVLNSRLNLRYMFARKQQLSLSVLGQNRNAVTGHISDWISTLAYEIAF